jgi:hypothetical protein
VLVLHGLLHLAGFDHEADEGQMARREARLRAELRLPAGLIERVGDPSRLRTAKVQTRRLEARRLEARGLKGQGFSRAVGATKMPVAAAAEEMSISSNEIPRGLKPRTPAKPLSARLKPGPLKAGTQAAKPVRTKAIEKAKRL